MRRTRPMRIICSALLALALLSGLPASTSAADAAPTSSCVKTAEGYRCLYGPVDVEEGENIVNATVPAPPKKGWITYARATLVDGSGRRIENHAVHLHHASWREPLKRQVICSYPELIYISGKERTRMQYPAGYGYLWDGDPETGWRLNSMLHGMHPGATTKAFIRLNYHFTPFEDADLVPVRNNWLPATGCGNGDEWTVTKGSGSGGFHRQKTDPIPMPASGRFVWGTGHLHDGGIKLVFRNLTKGTVIFRSTAIYASGRWDLTGTTRWSSATGVHVDKGDQVQVRAVYDSTNTWTDVMGNLRASFVPDPAPAG